MLITIKELVVLLYVSANKITQRDKLAYKGANV